MPLDLITQRLRLVAMTLEMLNADAAARLTDLSALLSAEVPAVWPPEHWEAHVFAFLREQIIHHPQTAGWNRYVVLTGTRPMLIGNVCAFPKSGTEAEVGYAILGPWRRLGMATESVLALTTKLFKIPSLRTITAQTFPDLNASIGVLNKCGFQLIGAGDEPHAVRYRLHRPL